MVLVLHIMLFEQTHTGGGRLMGFIHVLCIIIVWDIFAFDIFNRNTTNCI